MSTRTLDQGFMECAGCKRLCLQKRVVIAAPVELRALYVAPWCATVVTRSRVCETIKDGDGRIAMREFARVCSVQCFVKMLADPAWELVKPWPEPNRKVTMWIGEDRLAPELGSHGMPPMGPSTDWVLSEDRRASLSARGPYR